MPGVLDGAGDPADHGPDRLRSLSRDVINLGPVGGVEGEAGRFEHSSEPFGTPIPLDMAAWFIDRAPIRAHLDQRPSSLQHGVGVSAELDRREPSAFSILPIVAPL